ncbi:MAG: hypothetical protein O3C40_01060 [Planctomycetota bacterium]|nr:hypothetical protein [Planctomycetota bacterium]
MTHRSILPFVLCLVAISPATRAEEQAHMLEQLRHGYEQARDVAAKIEQPTRGSDGFRDKLKVWSDAIRKRREAAYALIPVLLEHWTILPDGSDELAATGKEIKAVYIDIAGKPLTQANSDARSFFADAVWPLLADNRLTQERAALFVELTEPHLGVRLNDKIAQLGKPTEPLDWNLQDAHSLALLRAGRIDDARRENELLLKKLTLNLERGLLPNVEVNYRNGKRTQQSLRREYLLHRALIEAVGEDKDKARKLLTEVTDIEEAEEITKQQESCVREIESRTSS